uniref:KIB1-4 beta-propeller domain-containing protein n=1 Tax=Davidia involucrata TaxID=16924 RepID=A0A5B7BVM8_DAVIN
MRNWRSFADGTIYCHRSLRKVCYGCSNIPVRFHNSCCTSGSLAGAGVGLGSIVRSSEFLRRRLREVDPAVARSLTSVSYSRDQGLGKAAPFSSVGRCFSSPPQAADDQATVLGPRAASFRPCLMLRRRGRATVDDEDEEMSETADDKDYYHLFSLAEQKEFRVKKNLRLPWQRELLSPDDAICVGSSHGWLAFIHPLPPVETLPSVCSSIRQKSTTSTSIAMQFVCRLFNSLTEVVSPENLSESFIEKIVFSSAPSPIPFPSNPYQLDTHNNNNEDCIVMAMQAGYGYLEEPVFCKPGDTAWTSLPGEMRDCIDILYLSKDQHFYILSRDQWVEAWDFRNPASPKSTLIEASIDKHELLPERPSDYCLIRYLAESSSGDLLMVIRCADGNYKTRQFEVYKLDFIRKKWVYLPSLGDGVLFVGANHSVSVTALDFPWLRKNSIYFACMDNEVIDNPRMTHDFGVFNLEDNSVAPFDGCDLKKIQLPPVWVVPSL